MATLRTVRRAALPLSLILLLALLSIAAGSAQRPAPAFRITALKAMLFYGETGTFSGDLFGSSAPTLQNVTTGPGQATATLVVVEITGQPDSYVPARKVTLRAAVGNRTLLSRTLGIGRPGDDGKFHSAFRVYDVGCMPVVLNARLVGQTPESTLQKTLNFKCGD